MDRSRRPQRLWRALLLLAAVSPLLAFSEESLEQRQARIESMSPEAKHALGQKKERFDSLSEDERQRMRRLHVEISTRPDADRLMQILARYNEWLKTISAVERAKLLGLPADERVARIKELVEKQQLRNFGFLADSKLPGKDVPKIFDWVNEYVDRHESDLYEALSSNRQEEYKKADARQRRRMLLFTLIRRRGGNASVLDPDEEQDLLSRLSPQAQDAIKNAPEDRRHWLVQIWVSGAVLAESLPRVDDAELKRFYTEDLNESDREQLDQLSPETQRRRLRMLYHFRHMRRPPGGGSRYPGDREGASRPRSGERPDADE